MEKYSRALGVKGEHTVLFGYQNEILWGNRIATDRPISCPGRPRRVPALLRDAAAATHRHAGARPVQHPEPGGDQLHAADGQRALRRRHAGAEVDAAAHAARVPQHQHGAQHQHHAGSAGGPLLRHGQEVSVQRHSASEG